MEIKITTPNDLMSKLQKLDANIGDIEDKMLESGTNVLLPEVKKNLQTAITGKYAEGELIKSVATKKKRTKKERANLIYFKGTVTRKFKNGKTAKVSNNLKAAVLEYGKQDQPARPFVRPAFNAKQAAIVSAMETTFEKEAQKYT